MSIFSHSTSQAQTKFIKLVSCQHKVVCKHFECLSAGEALQLQVGFMFTGCGHDVSSIVDTNTGVSVQRAADSYWPQCMSFKHCTQTIIVIDLIIPLRATIFAAPCLASKGTNYLPKKF